MYTNVIEEKGKKRMIILAEFFVLLTICSLLTSHEEGLMVTADQSDMFGTAMISIAVGNFAIFFLIAGIDLVRSAHAAVKLRCNRNQH